MINCEWRFWKRLYIIACETGWTFLTILIDFYKAFGLENAKSTFQFEGTDSDFEYFRTWH
jgi:hypothetical protein